jgi:hypothetical protein
MSNEVRLLVPENLDIDAIIKGNSQAFYGQNLKKEKALYVISALVKARTSQRKRMIEEDTAFVNLSSKILSDVVRDYVKYINFFLGIGILSTDNYFIRGEKCIGYCLNAPYAGKKLKEIEVSNYVLRKAIKQQRTLMKEEQKKSTWGYSYLTGWWDSEKLEIDIAAAYDWIENNKAEKILAINNNPKIKDKQYEIDIAIDTAEDFKYLVSKIHNNTFRYGFRGIGHRFYNPISNLKKELRQFLTFDGKPLVNIDIKNSQPFFSTVLLKPSFWESNSKFNIQTLMKDFLGTLVVDTIYKHIITVSKTSETIISKESCFKNYSDLVVSGEFYEFIQSNFSPLYPDRFKDRQSVKCEVLRIFFFNLTKEYLTYYKPCQTFKSFFPEVYEIFKLVKSSDYTNLPNILQRIESYLVIDVICKKISQLHPEIPLFTIHDSIITTQGNESIVEAIMRQEIEGLIGYKPMLSVEEMCPVSVAA